MKNLLSLSLICLSLFACDKQTPKLQYMPDMADNATVKPQESPLPPPRFSVAMDQDLFPDTPEKSEQILQSPIASDEANLAAGKKLWGIYCQVCHGADGKGKHSMTDAYTAAPPDITASVFQTRGDGFFFYRITNGATLMPAYGHATEVNERWQIILYLRQLQRGQQ